jgi:hypothetical protein
MMKIRTFIKKTRTSSWLLSSTTILLLASSGCKVLDPNTQQFQPDPVESPPIAAKELKSRLLASESNINMDDFGWLEDGRAYYAIKGGEQNTWYAYNSKDGLAESLDSPSPNVDLALYRTITEMGKINVSAVSAAPSGESVIYTHVPPDFRRPDKPLGDYFDPQELWMAQVGKQPILLSELFAYDCGVLGPKSRWLYDETLVFGQCWPYYGIEQYFIIDLLAPQTLHYLEFEMPNGSTDYPSIVEMAHRSPSLLFKVSTLPGLWIMPADMGERSVSTKMHDAFLLLEDYERSPLWSYDDQWIYYWKVGAAAYDQYGVAAYNPWWLERINIATHKQEIVLGEDDLRDILGKEMYETMYGAGYHWQLSSDGQQILLYISESNDAPNALFLIILQ